MSTSPVKEISSAPPLGRKSVLFFWASWHEQSNTGGAIDAVFGSLASAASAEVDFYRIEAESQPQLSLKVGYGIIIFVTKATSFDWIYLFQSFWGSLGMVRFLRIVLIMRSPGSY
uniref:Thioredoxin domain-containing protein n=1 Tax=Odontella aurita TaxID=265563 RepID=A0A7S4IXZ8_9STRA|mmetsp:Transcript_3275/g.8448  ORF Transcript_3275/g.8448 Transcript_3275/m.8448 type:complete len:115 (+) Transcript_3275:115-459(+)